ncbi:MAG: SMP-30/gluconolactonase/LRE family protein [Candidatus Latescibacteria bacterium]|nr:SMP-30/gluconolactonase/LRE family protein [Candidatus Latescibacterota bacterium]
MQIEKLAEENAVVGEGPMWDPQAQRLLWTDIAQGRLFSFDPATGANTRIHQGFNVGGFVLNQGGGLLLAIHDGVVLWRSDEDWVRVQPEAHQGETLRFNDVIADPEGRLFAGTYLEDRPGKLYRFDPDGKVSIVAEGIGCSNGMGFSPDLKTMYYTDAAARIIYAYDYNRQTGEVSNRRTFVKVSDRDGVPDGMTVDAQGFVWSANWFGSCIIRFDPEGVEERRIQTPAKQTSSVMFGGRDLDELYFTSADYKCEPGSPLDPVGYDWDDYNRAYRGGGLFRIRGLGIQGREEFKADFAWPAKK